MNNIFSCLFIYSHTTTLSTLICSINFLLLIHTFSGTDSSQAQLLGPDCKILGFAGMPPEDSTSRAQDFGLVQVK